MRSVGNGIVPVVQLGHTEESEQNEDAFHHHSSNQLKEKEIDDEK